MKNQQQAFLADIIENADDDTPRLVFADWLEDHNDIDRAQFIRAQIQLTRVHRFDEHYPELQWECSDLLRKHSSKWTKSFHKFTKRCGYLRGFVGRMNLTAEKFLQQREKIFASCPLEHLRPLQPDRVFDQLLDCEELTRLRTLDMHAFRLGMARVSKIANCPHLANLRELNLGSAKMRISGGLALMRSPFLSNLTSLHLNGNDLDAGFAESLAQTRIFSRLKQLDLASNQLGEPGLRTLGIADNLRTVEDLNLGGNSITSDGLRLLFAGHGWPELRRIDLRHTNLSAEVVSILAGCRSLANLEEMRLSEYRNLGKVKPLFQSPHLQSLRVLDLTNFQITDEDIIELLQLPYIQNLRVLRLPRISPTSTERILTSPSLKGLFNLVLLHCRLSNRRLAELLGSASYLTQLRRLNLQGSALGNDGLVEMARNPTFEKLTILELEGTGVGDASYRALVDSPSLVRLQHLSLYDAAIPQPGVQKKLQERYQISLSPWMEYPEHVG